MPTTYYGDGSLYGDADAIYGRISSELLAAQITSVRETGLKVRIIDERSNRWEFLAGVDQNPVAYHANEEFRNQKNQKYYSYRGQSDICVLDNGNFYRVRVDVDDQQIYDQTITDPTVTAQWTSWSLLYSGLHYSVAVAANGNIPVVYTAKSDGIYRNNSLEWSIANAMGIQCHRGSDGRQEVDKLWIKVVGDGGWSPQGGGRTLRKFDFYYTSDIESITPVEVPWNLGWFRHDVASIVRGDGKAVRLVTYPLYASELAGNGGESITAELVADPANIGTELKGPRLIRGLPGEYGHNTVSGSDIFKLSDGYYYIFYHEVHVSDDWEFSSNVETPLVWQRSKDLLAWSEPVHSGHNAWGFAGVVERNGIVYLCGNGAVHQRPGTSVEYDISDHVPQVGWESPRENQSGTGQLLVANPDDVHSEILDLSDRRIIIEPGIKTGAAYEYARLDDHWVKQIKKTLDGNANRLTVDFGNIWTRLENPMRDVINFIGRTDYHDWGDSEPNEPFAYYFDTGEGVAAGNVLSITEGLVLWTGWKGHNPNFQISFNTVAIDLYLRYKDENNYLKLAYASNTVTLTEVRLGVSTVIGTTAVGATGRLGVRARWKSFDIWVNGAVAVTYTHASPKLLSPGYVGWSNVGAYGVFDFDFEDLEYNYTSEDLIRQALAMGDYHDVKVGSASAKQYALTWGPQTDLPTPADGLRQVLEGEKLELIWRDGFIEVGQFKDVGVVKTIENRIINTELANAGNRRINLANVDGNEHTWFEVDIPDALERDRMINAYFDLPELLDKDKVRERAQEEIRRSGLAEAPGGLVPLFFDLWRMDVIEWVDNSGDSKTVRIEGIRVEINQSSEPSQRQQLDTSLV
jgi:hypothetical protein